MRAMYESGKFAPLFYQRDNCPFKEQKINAKEFYNTMQVIIDMADEMKFIDQLQFVKQDLDIAIILYELLKHKKSGKLVELLITKYESRSDFTNIINFVINSNDLIFLYHINLILKWIHVNSKFVNDYVKFSDDQNKINIYKEKKSEIMKCIKNREYDIRTLIHLINVSLSYGESEIYYLSLKCGLKLNTYIESLLFHVRTSNERLITLIKLKPELSKVVVNKIINDTHSMELLNIISQSDYKYSNQIMSEKKLELLLKDTKYDYKIMESLSSSMKTINDENLENIIGRHDVKLFDIFQNQIKKVETSSFTYFLTLETLKYFHDNFKKDKFTKSDIDRLFYNDEGIKMIEFIYKNNLCAEGITYVDGNLTHPIKEDNIYVFNIMLSNGAKITDFIMEYLSKKDAPKIKEYVKNMDKK